MMYTMCPIFGQTEHGCYVLILVVMDDVHDEVSGNELLKKYPVLILVVMDDVHDEHNNSPTLASHR